MSLIIMYKSLCLHSMLTTAWMVDLLVFSVGVIVSEILKTFFKLFFPYNYGPVYQWCNMIFIYVPHNA